MNDQAQLTVEVIRARRWPCVRLGGRSKKPVGPHWEITLDADQVARWFEAGQNVGLVCGEQSGVVVLDPDELLGWADMVDTLGQPSLPWMLTGSGKLHYPVRWEPELPAKLIWAREVIGEVQRGPNQQVVLPGSTHPTGGTYRWITEALGILCEPIDPVHDPLPQLPGEWLAFLRSHVYHR